MVQSAVIEEESGTLRGRVRAHNGYYAGNLSAISSIDSGVAVHASSRGPRGRECVLAPIHR